MRHPSALLLLASIGTVAPDVAIAQRPDFTGTWVLVIDSSAGRRSVAATGDASFRRGDMGSGWGSPLTIRQSADRLIVEYAFFSAYDLQPPLRFVYALDGTESHNTVMIGHAASDQRSTATWSGDSLVITTRLPGPDGPDGRPLMATIRQVLALDAGGALVIVTTRGGDGAVRTTWARR